MRTEPRLPLFLLAAGLLLAGCGRDASSLTSPGASSVAAEAERTEVASALAESPGVVEDGAFESADEWSSAAVSEFAAKSGASTFEAIRPLRWWRVIREVERSFEFAFSDTDSVGRPTRAIVTVHKRLRGTLNIVTGGRDSSGRGDSLALIRKPLADHWVRRILLHRVRTNDDSRVRWRIAAVSGVEVTARDAQTDIVSLRVQTATEDTTIASPLAFWFLRRIVRVHPGEPVTLTVTTLRNDDLVVLISRFGRFRFHNNGDNTYTGVWRAPSEGGIRHVGVNALSHGTLFDDQEPYDSKAWILPYAVRGEAVAEYLPEHP